MRAGRECEASGNGVRVEYAKLSLAGHRPENQDRVDVVATEETLLMVVVDGMGGHANGAKAAEVTVAALKECFAEVASPAIGRRAPSGARRESLRGNTATRAL
jgi:serine/threonine protein phosphatase PrpC